MKRVVRYIGRKPIYQSFGPGSGMRLPSIGRPIELRQIDPALDAPNLSRQQKPPQ